MESWLLKCIHTSSTLNMTIAIINLSRFRINSLCSVCLLKLVFSFMYYTCLPLKVGRFIMLTCWKTFIVQAISLIHPQVFKGQLQTNKQLDKQPTFVDEYQIYVILYHSHTLVICSNLVHGMSLKIRRSWIIHGIKPPINCSELSSFLGYLLPFI